MEEDRAVCLIIEALQSFGMIVWAEDGVVHGRMRDGDIPYEALAWVHRLQACNDQAARTLAADPHRVRVSRGLSVDAACGYAPGTGTEVLLCEYHKTSGTCDLYYREVG